MVVYLDIKSSKKSDRVDNKYSVNIACKATTGYQTDGRHKQSPTHNCMPHPE